MILKTDMAQACMEQIGMTQKQTDSNYVIELDFETYRLLIIFYDMYVCFRLVVHIKVDIITTYNNS